MKIQVCTWKSCKERFSEYIIKRLESDRDFYNWKNTMIEPCMCTWKCKEWPCVIFDSSHETHMNPAKASKIVFDKKNPKKSKNKNQDDQSRKKEKSHKENSPLENEIYA